MTTLQFLFAFIVMLGVLIFVHELGHFVVAKLCGVRVLKFSIGFGPTIGVGRWRLRWERGGTEYVVAWFPLGGFVKILGEHAGEEGQVEQIGTGRDHLGAKPLWQKLAIYFAGPAMNLVLPVVIFVGLLAVGTPRPAPVIGNVEPESPAAAAGLETGDRILAVDGQRMRFWDDVDEAIRRSPGDALSLRIEREGRELERTVPAQARAGLDTFGTVQRQGWLGVGHPRLAAKIGIPSADSPAARTDLRSGDLVTAVDGEPVESWDRLRERYAGAGTGGELTFTVRRRPQAAGVGAPGEPAQPGEGDPASEPAADTFEVAVPALGSLSELGVVPATVLIAGVSPDSPAEGAGLQRGDLILAVDGEPIGSFGSFAETVRASEGRPLDLVYARDGETQRATIEPELLTADTGLGIDEQRYMIGITADAANLPGAVVVEVERNPIVSIPRAVAMTYEVTRTYMIGLGKLISGDVPRSQIAGPIGIAVVAHNALQRGIEAYLSMMVLISINLAILNLLPIPVVDGGQIVLFAIEGVKRSPVSMRTREIMQSIGLTLIVLLMAFAFWNDFSRYWGELVEYVRETAGL